jgi:diamine N-acetyltransferase
MLQIKTASEADIPLIRSLAEKVWWPTYRAILREEQIEYMLENLYSEHTLLNNLRTGETFFLLHDKHGNQGFISYSPLKTDKSAWKINKLYVLPENHGNGYGRKLIDHVAELARQAGIKSLVLNVNRHNPAFTFYKKLGFEVFREEDIPIGPYWMNDYAMRLDIQRQI